jgi:ribosomal protein L11 methyltransferase
MSTTNQEQRWEEFSLITDQENADLINSALLDVLPSGLIIERIYDGVFPHEINQIDVPVRICAFLPVDEQLESTKSVIINVLNNLSREHSIPEPFFTPVMNRDWTSAWREKYQPISLGKRLIVVPSWLSNPDPDRIEIKMDPGMAFGSGTHPTTQMCLMLLENILDNTSLQQMIDIGCGSGILSIAAGKLGVEFILGTDIDPDAIKVSTANAKLNQVQDLTIFHTGSVNEILKGKLGINQAPLVVANMIAPILTDLFSMGLDKLVSPGGSLLLSGILEEQLIEMQEILDEKGFVLKKVHRMEDWTALWAEKPAVDNPTV